MRTHAFEIAGRAANLSCTLFIRCPLREDAAVPDGTPGELVLENLANSRRSHTILS